MPQITDITAKNAAAVNVVFKALVPASGETPALWRAQSVVSTPAAQPFITAVSRRNAAKDAMKLTGTIAVPFYVTDLNTGQNRVIGTMPFNFQVTRPDTYSDAFAADATAYVQSIFASTLFGDMIKNALSAT